MTYLWEVTITTGQGARAARADTPPQDINALTPALEDAIATGQRVQINPAPVPQLSLEATAAGPHLVATIWDDKADLPLTTILVATMSRGAGKLWATAHQIAAATTTDPGDVPAAPWSATVTHPSSLARPDALLHLGKLGTAIAWAWLGMREAGHED